MARYFIDRPVFAWVLALGIMLAGLIALRGLPIEQYPQVAPPSLTITVTYPGADATTLEENVTQVIEQQLNGVDGFLYMASTSRSNGTAEITLTFEAGTDIDIAQTEVQNRLSTVEARLPEQVRRQGITVRQTSAGFLMIVALTSKSGDTSTLELSNYAANQVVDELRRVQGVGDVILFGSEYAMRIWLDPEKLASYSLSPSAVLAAVQEQNSQTAGGSLGALPNGDTAQVNATIITEGRFSTAEEFEQIILRANPDGSTVRLADVARVELGAQTYNQTTALNGQPMAGIAVQLATGANAIATATGVRERMEELEGGFPPDIAWQVPFDTTPFVTSSVEEVVKTLVEAMALVFLVMFLFLQSWRATIIPTLVVPIALAGACLGLWVFGFSINVLSLFGMVLAIGILVDDAIVVIENVERIMDEEGLPPLEATRKAMDQITGAIVGITLVLAAVFLPMAFFPGSTGGIYRQFSVTLAISILFSALMALTLTPALCATLLKPHSGERGGRFFGKFFAKFNGWFGRSTERYQHATRRILTTPMRWLAIFLALVIATVFLFLRLPGGFLPTEDQGYAITAIQAPPGATRGRLNEALDPISEFWFENEAVEDTVVIRGFSFFGQGQNMALIFTNMKPWEERTTDETSAESLIQQANIVFSQIEGAMAFVINPPPIQQLGNASGFTFKLEDRGSVGREALNAAQGQLLGAAMQSSVLAGVRPETQPNSPELRVEIDRLRATSLGLSIADVNAALSINFGSAYVNDFTREGRVLQVLVQAEAASRLEPEDVLDIRIPNRNGELVPFSAFSSVEWTAGPPQLQRYNGYPALTISGTPAPGVSSGEALLEMERLAADLPEGIGYEWTGTSYEEKQAGGQVGALLGLSVIVVFLLLAALYESWAIPVSVLLIVPMGVLGAVIFSMIRGLSADVYFNVGLITIIGLAAKNAILIVEFAIEAEEAGQKPFDAVLEAARLRLRPIIMTSLAFILGMVPLVLASGAGAASRIAVGSGVMGGMIAATALGIFFIPALYLVVRRHLSRQRPHAAGTLEAKEESAGAAQTEGTSGATHDA
ncbi:efflux RND transporter permease subunit [Pacificimonas flava]|uniref:Efflux pump membrane transporter n=1 Tax=Pacificimonas flava TaxID=1234595 RepID=M2U1Z3_9SPHN|nr:efflux RND transporter permease subunit [Pacificimonas flava]EMD82012.1 RND efflux system, inner membrane transporter CmeB [Pacificimonas flava]MBB5280425.1 multidrug efflux pump [Pacificimonas flava]